MLLGAYVLGGLDAVDRREVKNHLRHCPECCAELVDVAALPALLRRISTDEAAGVDRPGDRESVPAAGGEAAQCEVADHQGPRWRENPVPLAAAAVVSAALPAGGVLMQRQRGHGQGDGPAGDPSGSKSA